MMRLLIVACALDALIFAIITLGNCRRGEYASSAAWSCLQSGKWQGRIFVPAIDTVFGWLAGWVMLITAKQAGRVKSICMR